MTIMYVFHDGYWPFMTLKYNKCTMIILYLYIIIYSLYINKYKVNFILVLILYLIVILFYT